MSSGGPLHAVPKLCDGDGSYFELLIRTGSQPTFEIKSPFLAANDDVRIQNYCHLPPGGFSVLRAVCMSRCQAAASLAGRSALAKASARSLPVQTFRPSGTKRATGEPFLSRIKVVFW